MGLAAQQKGAHTGIRPGLCGLTQAVSGSPRRGPARKHALQVPNRHPRHPTALLQRLGLRKESLPCDRIPRAPLCLRITIRLEPHIGPRVFPVHGSEPFDFPFALQRLLLRQPSVILGGPELRLRLCLFLCLCLCLRLTHSYSNGIETIRIECQAVVVICPNGAGLEGEEPEGEEPEEEDTRPEGEAIRLTGEDTTPPNAISIISDATNKESPSDLRCAPP